MPSRFSSLPIKRLTRDDRMCDMLDSPAYGDEFTKLMHEALTVLSVYRKQPTLTQVAWRAKYKLRSRSMLPELAVMLDKFDRWMANVRQACPKAMSRMGLRKRPLTEKVGSKKSAADKGITARD